MRILLVVLLVATLGCEPSRPTPTPTPTSCAVRSTTTTRDVPDAELVALDLTVPVRGGRCGPTPIVVWVHGGGFAIGDKANGVAAMTRWATAKGWAFASVNYRLSPPVVHPAHVSDVADAIGWLADHAGQHGLDPDRIVLVGHSAGAFLVSLLATDDHYLAAAGVELDQIRAVAALDTRYDIAAEIADGEAGAEAMYRNAFGDDPDVWHDASPQTHAGTSPSEPPFVVVTRGRADRIASARTFAATLDQATVVDASPLTHAQVGDALGQAGDHVVTPPVTDLFRRALGAGKAPR